MATPESSDHTCLHIGHVVDPSKENVDVRKIAFPVFVAVVGTVALNAFAFGTTSGASVKPVSGVLYRDLNNNGRREAAEPGIPGVVVASTKRSTVTNRAGKWSLDVADGDRLTVQTGWYRSQCDQPTCAAGPGPDQDFGARYQAITVKVRDGKSRFDVGLLPDWKGGYPIPSTKPIRANRKDVSARISFVKPISGAGESNCFRTDTAANRACQVGDRPTFLVQIYNEGTTSITRPGGHLELPAGTRLLSLAPSSLRNHPALGTARHAAMDPVTRRIPFRILGTLPPAGMAVYELSLVVEPDAPITTKLQTKGGFPNEVGVRIMTVPGDVEGARCLSNSMKCRWGTTNRQKYPDNSDTTGFAIVPTAAPRVVEAPAPVKPLPTTTLLPTAPARASLTEAIPATATVAPTTVAPTTVAPTTVAPTTVAPTTTMATTPATTAPTVIAPTAVDCTVSWSGSAATLNWNPSGGDDVVRRNGSWLTTPSRGSGSYVDQATSSGASYVIRAWSNGDSVDHACTVVAGSAAPVTVPPTTVPSAAGCSVSMLLVPSCGVWFGASTASRDGSYDYVRGLAEYEAVAQNTPDILHFYHRGAANFPTSGEIAMAERPGKQRSLLLYNWKPSMSLTWRQIAQGGADANIAKVAANLKKYPHQLYLAPFHEPEDNVKTATSSGMTPQDYADMYRHVVTELRRLGVTNAVFVWNMMGYEGWASYFDDLYPGDAYVDWIAYDPYAHKNVHDDLGELINWPRPNLGWPGFYDWASAKAPSKPMMLAEWGVDVPTTSNPAAVLNVDAAQILAEYPKLKALVFWNDEATFDTRLDYTSSKGVALGEAYRKLAAQPIFNTITPDIAP